MEVSMSFAYAICIFSDMNDMNVAAKILFIILNYYVVLRLGTKTKFIVKNSERSPENFNVLNSVAMAKVCVQ